MDVRLDKGGDGEPLLTIKLMGCEQMGAHGFDGSDQAILAEDLPHPSLPTRRRFFISMFLLPFSNTNGFFNPQLSLDQFDRKAFILNTYETVTIDKQQQ